MKGILNKQNFRCILQSEAIPCGSCLIETTFLLKQDNNPNHSSKTELLIIWYVGSAHQTNQKKAVGGASRSLEYLKSQSQSLRL